MLATANGIITFDAADYAPDATKQYRALFEETGRKIYYAGPLIPQGVEDTSKDPRSEKISQFLDEKLASHGERSVIYVSGKKCDTNVMLVLTRTLYLARFHLGPSSGRWTTPSCGRS